MNHEYEISKQWEPNFHLIFKSFIYYSSECPQPQEQGKLNKRFLLYCKMLNHCESGKLSKVISKNSLGKVGVLAHYPRATISPYVEFLCKIVEVERTFLHCKPLQSDKASASVCLVRTPPQLFGLQWGCFRARPVRVKPFWNPPQRKLMPESNLC